MMIIYHRLKFHDAWLSKWIVNPAFRGMTTQNGSAVIAI